MHKQNISKNRNNVEIKVAYIKPLRGCNGDGGWLIYTQIISPFTLKRPSHTNNNDNTKGPAQHFTGALMT